MKYCYSLAGKVWVSINYYIFIKTAGNNKVRGFNGIIVGYLSIKRTIHVILSYLPLYVHKHIKILTVLSIFCDF